MSKPREVRNRVRIPVLLTMQQALMLCTATESLTYASPGTRERWRRVRLAASVAIDKATADGLTVPPAETKGCTVRHPDSHTRCVLGRTHAGRMHRTREGVQFR